MGRGEERGRVRGKGGTWREGGKEGGEGEVSNMPRMCELVGRLNIRFREDENHSGVQM